MDIQTLTTSYAGRRAYLFGLALKTSILTVLTLGFYRFWMKTRLRRFYWSAICPGGVPLEYTGTGVEKLMGFLVAVVVMAFYIGVFNLVLMFLSYSLLNDNFAAYAMSFVGVIPIYFYAQYRARRYVLARTRWRGLRFGIDPAAWSYAWRAMLHWLATLLTLGILWPRQVFWLEKFRVDRTLFGTARFRQEGRWTMLLRPARQFYLGLAVSGVAIGLGSLNEAGFALMVIGLPWVALGMVHFQVQSFRVLAEHKWLNDTIQFQAAPRTGRVLRIYLLGYGLAVLTLVAGVVVVLVGLGISVAIFDPGGADAAWLEAVIGSQVWRDYAGYVFGALAYFSFFIFWGVLTQVFVTLPLLQHYAETVSISGSHHLPAISQRPRDEFTEAEGFAEALDIGAAI